LLAKLLVFKDLLAEKGVMDLGLLGLFVEGNFYRLALETDLVYSRHDSEELHVQAQSLPLWLKTVNELVTPHVDVEVVVVIASAHDHY